MQGQGKSEGGKGLSEADFERFRHFFCQHTGIEFEPEHRAHVQRRLEERKRETGRISLAVYLDYLFADESGAELDEVIRLLTVKETYFFRETYQFDALVDEVLPEWDAQLRPGKSLRILSLPCSTGEELYSVALYLLTRWPRVDEVAVDLVGADIDREAVAAARRGTYDPYKLRNLPVALQERFFSHLADGRYQIHTRLRESIVFRPANALHLSQIQSLGSFDVIFCRNMLIYMESQFRQQVAENLFKALRPDGILFLGHSESMSRIPSRFQTRKFGNVFAYQKPRAVQ